MHWVAPNRAMGPRDMPIRILTILPSFGSGSFLYTGRSMAPKGQAPS
jgi:hypothetical protein